jgi:hypothetical protein
VVRKVYQRQIFYKVLCLESPHVEGPGLEGGVVLVGCESGPGGDGGERALAAGGAETALVVDEVFVVVALVQLGQGLFDLSARRRVARHPVAGHLAEVGGPVRRLVLFRGRRSRAVGPGAQARLVSREYVCSAHRAVEPCHVRAQERRQLRKTVRMRSDELVLD